MANVAFIRPEIAKLLPMYNLIRDVLAGEPTVKAAGVLYLPMPNSEDQSPANKARFDAYLKRAVFYNVARRTMSGLIGQVFMRDPLVTLPAQLEVLGEDATGEGVTLVQLARKAVALNLAYSRGGVFVDYPMTVQPDGSVGASVADVQSGKVRPTLYVYAPQEIINWRTITRGAEEVLSLVVIYETFCVSDDGFEMKNAGQFRVMRLDDQGLYVHEIWREPNMPTEADGSKIPKTGNFQMHETFLPTDSSGNRLDTIPFTFFGSENNDSNPDNPSFYDLASLNLAHYRNSADYEESCYIVGQPTPVLTGLTEEWFDGVLKGKINFGSRGGIPLPAGATAELIQAEANTMIKEAMDTKERQMVALGAKLVEQAEVQRTATEAGIEAASEGSTLASATKNVAAAFTWACKFAATWVGIADSTIQFELNTDFDVARMTPEERQELLKEWQAGAITFEEMRAGLRKAGVATEDDEAAKAKIAADQAEQLAATMEAQAAADPNSVGTGEGDAGSEGGQ